MKNDQTFEKDLASIRQLMERSVKFISLSGLSGILSGFYALIGASVAYFLIQYPDSIFEYQIYPIQNTTALKELVFIGASVLVASLTTGVWLSSRKAKQRGIKVWDATGRRLLINLSIPLVTGGLFILISAWNGYYEIVAGASLIFYGIALVNASPNLYDEIRYLGYSEIILGLFSEAMSGYNLVFWSIGFGFLHIIYGAAMYRKYD